MLCLWGMWVFAICKFYILVLMKLWNVVGLKDDKRVLNRCMDGMHHLQKPVSTKLFGVVSIVCNSSIYMHTYNFILGYVNSHPSVNHGSRTVAVAMLLHFILKRCCRNCTISIWIIVAICRKSARKDFFSVAAFMNAHRTLDRGSKRYENEIHCDFCFELHAML